MVAPRFTRGIECLEGLDAFDSDVETDDCFDFSERPMEYASRDQVVTPVTGEAECIKLQQNGQMALQPRRRRLATQ